MEPLVQLPAPGGFVVAVLRDEMGLWLGSRRDSAERYGATLIEEEGFACAAELLAKLARMGMRIDEVPVRLDWTRRAGKSKMPVAATILGYWRMLLRARAAGEPARG